MSSRAAMRSSSLAEVVREQSSPSYPARDHALEFIAGIPLLALDEEVQGLARILIR